MNILRPLGALLILALLPGVGAAQSTQPARYVGDDASYSPNSPRDRLGFAGSRSSSNVGGATDFNKAGRAANQPNDGRTQPITYYKYRRDGSGNLVNPLAIDPTPVTLTLPISAAAWLDFIRDHVNREDLAVPAGQRFADVDFDGRNDATQNPRPTPLSFDAPRNKIAVVDQGVRQERIDRGQPPEVFTTRLVTVVTRWIEVTPIYGTSCVTAYPCCCTQCFSYVVRYQYTPRTATTYEYRPVADYPTTEIAVDRGIVMLNGNPQYTTQVPRLCEFHYGANAKIVLPTVPLVSDIRDIPQTTQVQVTVTGDNQTGTTITAPVTQALVEGSQPRGNQPGGLPLPAGRPVGALTTNPDRGTTTFQGDVVTVADVVNRTNEGRGGDPYAFKEAR